MVVRDIEVDVDVRSRTAAGKEDSSAEGRLAVVEGVAGDGQALGRASERRHLEQVATRALEIHSVDRQNQRRVAAGRDADAVVSAGRVVRADDRLVAVAVGDGEDQAAGAVDDAQRIAAASVQDVAEKVGGTGKVDEGRRSGRSRAAAHDRVGQREAGDIGCQDRIVGA